MQAEAGQGPLRALMMGVAIAALGAFASPAAAATVTSGSDSLVPQPGELRYEIANADPGETVEIVPGVNPSLSQGHILINKDLTVEGQGADATIVGSSASSRIFMISLMSSQAVVTIRDLTINSGHAPNGAAGAGAGGTGGLGEPGGAIHNSEELTIDRVLFFGNSAGNGGDGSAGSNGAPGNPGGPGGTGGAGGSGGALFNTVGGDVTVIDSTFELNSAGDGGDGGQGGDGGAGMFPIAGSGGAGGLGRDGGAIQNTGDLTVTNSTFFGNRSGEGGTGGDKGDFGGFAAGGEGGDGGDGGAIHQGGAGSVTISNSTIAGNLADNGGEGGIGSAGQAASGADGIGGGTFFFTGPSAIVVANSLYAVNRRAIGPDSSIASNCSGPGTITAQGANLSFPSGGCPGSFSNGNPQLADLADNGGPTRTMALGPGSAAIDQVPVGSPGCPGADQRGVTRPQGPTCDIGAFEVIQPLPPGVPPPVAQTPLTGTAPMAPTAKRKCKKKRKTGAAAAAKRKRCKKRRK
jgi:hypothetical protein